MRWSVALFGYYKPRFYLQDKATGLNVSAHLERPVGFDEDRFRIHETIGWKKRAEPGDVIAFKPIDQADRWTDRERSSFLIVSIDGPSLEQMGSGMVEPYWDLDSYPAEPMPSHREIGGTLEEYLEFREHAMMYHGFPRDYLKKRRFHVPLIDLADMGVDLRKMLNKEILYSPKGIDFKHTEVCFDKMKKRKIAQQDRLRWIDRREVV